MSNSPRLDHDFPHVSPLARPLHPPPATSGRKLKPHGPTSNENPASDLSQHFQLVQQEHDLHYYRSFLENLVSVVRDGHADTVAQIVSLIRSGASNEEIHRAIQPVNE